MQAEPQQASWKCVLWRESCSAPDMGAGVPLYVHPAAATTSWATLAVADAPVHWAILNQDSGPGKVEDPELYGPARAIRDGGTRVLGYIPLAGGTRGDYFNNADADTYVKRGFTGAFLDQCPSDAVRVQATALTVLRQRARGMTYVVLNPGTVPARGYCDIADQVVVFENDLAAYRSATFPKWMREYPPSRFAHLVHGVDTAEQATEVAELAWLRGCGTVFAHSTKYAPDTNTWTGLPAYWPEFARTLRRLS